MLKPPPPYQLRAIQLSDIPGLINIENKSFPKPWKVSAYKHEITNNKLASYQVLTAQTKDEDDYIVGYTGHWLMANEIHISTIATHPKWRGRHLGELLLLNTLFLAYEYQEPPAVLVTLEVRPSNTIAQNLYRKYRFRQVGRRKRYYHDKEDALLLTAEPLDTAYYQFLESQWARLSKQLENG